MINILYKSLLPQHIYILLRKHLALYITLYIYSTSWVFNSVRVSLLYLALFISHSYDISYSCTPFLYPTFISYSYISLLYLLLDPIPISHFYIPLYVFVYLPLCLPYQSCGPWIIQASHTCLDQAFFLEFSKI